MKKRKRSGYTKPQALNVLNQLAEKLQAPLQMVAYGKLTDRAQDYIGLQAGKGLDSIQAVYDRFREVKPRGRWAICVTDSGNSATIIDTQVIEKALDLTVLT
jgi:hypothetical protein